MPGYWNQANEVLGKMEEENILFFKILFYFYYVYCVDIHAGMCSDYSSDIGQRCWVMEWKLQMIVSHNMWVWGTELGSSLSLLTAKPSLQPEITFFVFF